MGGYFWQKFPSAANAYGKLTGWREVCASHDVDSNKYRLIHFSLGTPKKREWKSWNDMKQEKPPSKRVVWCQKQLQRSMEHLASAKWCIYIYTFLPFSKSYSYTSLPSPCCQTKVSQVCQSHRHIGAQLLKKHVDQADKYLPVFVRILPTKLYLNITCQLVTYKFESFLFWVSKTISNISTQILTILPGPGPNKKVPNKPVNHTPAWAYL